MVECLLKKCEALNSNPNTTKTFYFQNGWLNTTEMYCFIVLEVRKRNLDIHKTTLLLKPVEKSSFPLPTTGSLSEIFSMFWPVNTLLQSSVFTQSSSYKDPSHVRRGVQLTLLHDLILTNVLTKILFPNKVTF
jgi:hypothetical protein